MDINVRPGVQVELLYNRQDSDLTFKSATGTEPITGISVEYFHVGAVGGFQRG